jgi:hypothetical protein
MLQTVPLLADVLPLASLITMPLGLGLKSLGFAPLVMEVRVIQR